VDAVAHLAAKVGLETSVDDFPDYVEHNCLGTAVGLAALRRAGFGGRLVLASSMVVYGEGGWLCAEHGPVAPAPRKTADLEQGQFEPPCPVCGADLSSCPVEESAPLAPRSVYAASKVHQEHLADAFSRSTGVPVTAMRFHNVFGPGMPRDTPYAGVAAIFASALRGGQRPRVTEDGWQKRDFVHVDDVARATVLALVENESAGEALNIASGNPTTVLEMAEAMWTAAGGSPELRPTVTGEFRAGDVRHVFASTERAEARLGFRAEVDLLQGLDGLLGALVGAKSDR